MPAEASHAAAEHGTAELVSAFELLHQAFAGIPAVEWLLRWQHLWFTGLAMLLLGLLASRGTRRRGLIPTGLENGVESVIQGFDRFVCGILGPRGHAHTPFIGTLFLYILIMNVMGLLPLLRSPTAGSAPSPIGLPVPLTTLPLAVCAVGYVNLASVRTAGLAGYLHHLLGSPSHFVLWLVSPLILVIHAIGELGKIFSLSMRLFGNIFGEDMLIAVIVKQAVALTQSLHWPPVIPLQLPFLLLGLLTSLVQAFVFALLTTIYLALMLPHEEHEESAVAHA